jgi:hypothetical protein
MAAYVPFQEREPSDMEHSPGMVMRYDSLADYEAARPSKINAELYREYKTRYSEDGSTKAFLGATLADTCQIVGSNQWPEGLAKMEKALEGLDVDLPRAKSIKRRRAWHDAGDSLDMGRVWAGQLDKAWQRCDRVPMTGSRRVTITFPLVYSAGNSTESMFWGGAAALKLADILIAAGYAVEIVGIHGNISRKNRDKAFMVATAKPFNAPLDMQALILPMAFAGYMRTVSFTGIMAMPVSTDSGLGQAIYNPFDEKEIRDHIGGEIIPAETFDSAHEAKAWLQTKLQKLQGDMLLAA